MVDIVSYCLIGITCFCFGLIVSFQIAHIQYLQETDHSRAAFHLNKAPLPRYLQNMKQ